MKTVPVYTLRVRPLERGCHPVDFRRYRHDRDVTLFVRPDNVIGMHPLQVIVCIPPEFRESSLTEFETEEILLVHAAIKPEPLQSE